MANNYKKQQQAYLADLNLLKSELEAEVTHYQQKVSFNKQRLAGLKKAIAMAEKTISKEVD